MTTRAEEFLSTDDVRLAIWPRLIDDETELERIRGLLNEQPLCPKCGLKCSWKSREKYGACPQCYRVFSVPGSVQVGYAASDEVIARVRELRFNGTPTSHIASALTREGFEPPFAARGARWDELACQVAFARRP